MQLFFTFYFVFHNSYDTVKNMIDPHHTNLYLAFMSGTGGIIHTAEWPYFSVDYLLSAFSTDELRFTFSRGYLKETYLTIRNTKVSKEEECVKNTTTYKKGEI